MGQALPGGRRRRDRYRHRPAEWAIHTLGRYFVGHVLVQPGQTVISTGPYRWQPTGAAGLICPVLAEAAEPVNLNEAPLSGIY